MVKVKNKNGKTICKANAKEKEIEIVHKGTKTKIKFLSDDKLQIIYID